MLDPFLEQCWLLRLWVHFLDMLICGCALLGTFPKLVCVFFQLRGLRPLLCLQGNTAGL